MLFPDLHSSSFLSRSATREETCIYHVYQQYSRIVSRLMRGEFGETSKSLKIIYNLLSPTLSFAFHVFIHSYIC